MVQLQVRITAATGQFHQVIEALHSVMRGVLREGVCSEAHLASDVDEGNVAWYFEEWPSAEEFERHLRSDRFARLLAVLEISAEPPSLQCRLVSESRGLDYVAAQRGVAAPSL
jgi:quinol monooxygenase YgiN